MCIYIHIYIYIYNSQGSPCPEDSFFVQDTGIFHVWVLLSFQQPKFRICFVSSELIAVSSELLKCRLLKRRSEHLLSIFRLRQRHLGR